MKSGVVGKVSRMRAITTFIGLAAVVSLAGCGKKGPLVYPDMLLPGPPQAVLLDQSGEFLRLSFDLPTKDRTGKSLKEELQSVVVLRKSVASGGCSSCLDEYRQMLAIDPANPVPAQRKGNRIVWIDQQTGLGEIYQYRIKIVQRGGEAGSLADTIKAKVQMPPAAPGLEARQEFGGVVVVTVSPKALVDTTELVGYQLYRASYDNINDMEPLGGLTNELRFVDQSVQRGMVYRYAARTFVRQKGDKGLQMESSISNVVEVVIKDDM